MTTTFELGPYLRERREAVDAALDRALPAIREGDDPRDLKAGMRYAVLQGGKRMRPLITIAACEAVGGAMEAALPPSCALEMIHAYSLVHDDLPAMDNDLERRGLPTVHVKFGEAGAILVGDALLTHAFTVLTTGEVPRDRAAAAVARLAHHAGIFGMVGGQALDLVHGQDIRDLEVLEQVHALKTGALYAAAGAMGAIVGGADQAVVDRLERWGLCFGIAFQHADDMLDDDQKHLRAAALARVDELVKECHALAAGFGERGGALRGLAEWVRLRAHDAAAGHRAD
ncbi:MAG: polyprenyl synthetase family protein [Nannocystaceae bacterium]